MWSRPVRVTKTGGGDTEPLVLIFVMLQVRKMPRHNFARCKVSAAWPRALILTRGRQEMRSQSEVLGSASSAIRAELRAGGAGRHP